MQLFPDDEAVKTTSGSLSTLDLVVGFISLVLGLVIFWGVILALSAIFQAL